MKKDEKLKQILKSHGIVNAKLKYEILFLFGVINLCCTKSIYHKDCETWIKNVDGKGYRNCPFYVI